MHQEDADCILSFLTTNAWLLYHKESETKVAPFLAMFRVKKQKPTDLFTKLTETNRDKELCLQKLH